LIVVEQTHQACILGQDEVSEKRSDTLNSIAYPDVESGNKLYPKPYRTGFRSNSLKYRKAVADIL
jgi:hypothetical protein